MKVDRFTTDVRVEGVLVEENLHNLHNVSRGTDLPRA